MITSEVAALTTTTITVSLNGAGPETYPARYFVDEYLKFVAAFPAPVVGRLLAEGAVA